MSDEFFKLAKDILRTQYPQPKPVRYYCIDCGDEYNEEISRCVRVIEPETEELFALLCEGKIREIGGD